MQAPHNKAPGRELNLRPSRREAAALTAAPPGRPFNPRQPQDFYIVSLESLPATWPGGQKLSS